MPTAPLSAFWITSPAAGPPAATAPACLSRHRKPGIHGIVPSNSGSFAITARVAARDLNSGLAVSAAPPQSVALVVQNPPSLAALTNSLQPAYVSGGTVYQFQINVVNNGGSTLLLDPTRTAFAIVDTTTGLELFSSLLDASFGSSLAVHMSARTLYSIQGFPAASPRTLSHRLLPPARKTATPSDRPEAEITGSGGEPA